MRIFDRLMRRKQRTPRVIKVEPDSLYIEARGCLVVIHEMRTDKLGREFTEIIVTRDFALSDDAPLQLIANPAAFPNSRTQAAIHVVKLKAPRKPKQAKPPEKASEGPAGGAGGEGTQSIWAAAGDKEAS